MIDSQHTSSDGDSTYVPSVRPARAGRRAAENAEPFDSAAIFAKVQGVIGCLHGNVEATNKNETASEYQPSLVAGRRKRGGDSFLLDHNIPVALPPGGGKVSAESVPEQAGCDESGLAKEHAPTHEHSTKPSKVEVDQQANKPPLKFYSTKETGSSGGSFKFKFGQRKGNVGKESLSAQSAARMAEERYHHPAVSPTNFKKDTVKSNPTTEKVDTPILPIAQSSSDLCTVESKESSPVSHQSSMPVPSRAGSSESDRQQEQKPTTFSNESTPDLLKKQPRNPMSRNRTPSVIADDSRDDLSSVNRPVTDHAKEQASRKSERLRMLEDELAALGGDIDDIGSHVSPDFETKGSKWEEKRDVLIPQKGRWKIPSRAAGGDLIGIVVGANGENSNELRQIDQLKRENERLRMVQSKGSFEENIKLRNLVVQIHKCIHTALLCEQAEKQLIIEKMQKENASLLALNKKYDKIQADTDGLEANFQGKIVQMKEEIRVLKKREKKHKEIHHELEAQLARVHSQNVAREQKCRELKENGADVDKIEKLNVAIGQKDALIERLNREVAVVKRAVESGERKNRMQIRPCKVEGREREQELQTGLEEKDHQIPLLKENFHPMQDRGRRDMNKERHSHVAAKGHVTDHVADKRNEPRHGTGGRQDAHTWNDSEDVPKDLRSMAQLASKSNNVPHRASSTGIAEKIHCRAEEEDGDGWEEALQWEMDEVKDGSEEYDDDFESADEDTQNLGSKRDGRSASATKPSNRNFKNHQKDSVDQGGTRKKIIAVRSKGLPNNKPSGAAIQPKTPQRLNGKLAEGRPIGLRRVPLSKRNPNKMKPRML